MSNKLGATNDFPEGKLNANDEGGLRLAVGAQDGKVILDFGTPVVWIGMDVATAITVGRALIDKAWAIQNPAPGEH